MNQIPNVSSFDEIVEATGRPTLIAVAVLGLAIVIGSIIAERRGHKPA
jgi:hypothetical protein